MSKCPTVSYRVRGSPPRTTSRGRGRPARAFALVYIDLGVEAAKPAVNRAHLKGCLIIEIYLERVTVFLIRSGCRFSGTQRITSALRRHFGFASDALKFPAGRSTAAGPVCGYQKMPPRSGGICGYLLKSL